MTWIFLSITIGGSLSLLITPLFIRFQRSKRIGGKIRIDGPKTHSVKMGTPTMGGIIFVLSSMAAFIVVSLVKYYRHGVYSAEGIFVLSVLLLCSLIGFVDDYIALKKQRSLGLRWWVKLSLLAVVCVYFVLCSKYIINIGTYISIPFTDIRFEMGNWYYIIVVLVIVSTTNAVNLTDGLDGLAAGASSIVLAVFCFIAFFEWSIPPGVPYGIDIAVVSAGTLAACAGFLWWNTAPAEIFMGDTGSFGLGGLIAAVAIILKQEILLIIIGGLFVIETLSVIIQIIWFKTFKKRVFKMAPIHHHFELLGWPEIKVIIRFWIACMLFSGVGFFIYYLKFID